MEIFDTHAHYDDDRFKKDLIETLDKCKEIGVNDITLIGDSLSDSLKERVLCHKLNNEYKKINFYWTLGIHPDNVLFLENTINYDNIFDDEEAQNLMEEFENIIIEEKEKKDSKLVGIGEIGLDYHGDEKKDKKVRENQKLWFATQIELANKYQLPISIHSRDAQNDTLNLLRDFTPKYGGVMHCYAYTRDVVDEFISMGLYIGVGGVVTFKNGWKLKDTLKHISLEKVVLETDSPYLSPEPFRGTRNDSSNLKYIIKEIANIKHMDEEEISKILYENALKLYKIKK